MRRACPAPSSFGEAALGADFGRGGDEQLDVGVGRDHRADVAAVEHRAALLRGEALLPVEQGLRGPSA